MVYVTRVHASNKNWLVCCPVIWYIFDTYCY